MKKTNGNNAKTKKIILISVITIASLAALIATAFFIVTRYYYGLLNFDPLDGGYVPITTIDYDPYAPPTDAPNETTPAPETSLPSDTTTPDTTAPDSTESTTAPTPSDTDVPHVLPPDMPQPPVLTPDGDDVKHILLIGADYVSDNGLSDIMVIASINNTEKTITCTSLMRDTYAYVPIEGGLRTKLNAAHQKGGIKLLIDTIELNFGIKLDNYMKLDFEKAVDVFDRLGGLEIKIDKAEAEFIRKWEPSSKLEFDSSKADADGYATVHLNGAELRAHARNRSTGGGVDFNRTRRQRDILTAAFEKAKTMSFSQLLTFLDGVFPLVTTDINYLEFVGYILNAPSYSSYDFQTFRIPSANCWKYWSYYILITDPERTMREWYDLVYN